MVDNADPSSPSRWGPLFWPQIHYTGKRLDAMIQFDLSNPTPRYTRSRKVLWDYLQNLDHHLPCEDPCATHYRAYIQEHPLPSWAPTEVTPHQFFHITVDIHNYVNQITGKRKFTYEEADEHFKKTWDAPQTRDDTQNPVNLGWLLATLGITVLSVLIIIWLLVRK